MQKERDFWHGHHEGLKKWDNVAGHVARINSDRDLPSPTCQRSFRWEFTIRAKWGFLRKTLSELLPVVDWIHPPSIGRNSAFSIFLSLSLSLSLFLFLFFLGCSAFIGFRWILRESLRFRYVFYLRARRCDRLSGWPAWGPNEISGRGTRGENKLRQNRFSHWLSSNVPLNTLT